MAAWARSKPMSQKRDMGHPPGFVGIQTWATRLSITLFRKSQHVSEATQSEVGEKDGSQTETDAHEDIPLLKTFDTRIQKKNASSNVNERHQPVTYSLNRSQTLTIRKPGSLQNLRVGRRRPKRIGPSCVHAFFIEVAHATSTSKSSAPAAQTPAPESRTAQSPSTPTIPLTRSGDAAGPSERSSFHRAACNSPPAALR
jgi:hypothetical protein